MRQWLLHIHRDDSGASTVEYLLVLATVVIPLIALTPDAAQMVRNYFYRAVEMVRIPFP